MSIATSLDAYRAHDLNIQMRTSSGDILSLDLSNQQSLSMNSQRDGTAQSGSFSFASMQSFQFSVQSNGLDAQDREEIAQMMEVAKPYIEKFMKELESGEERTPLNSVLKNVTDALSSIKERDLNVQNFAKNSMVKLFDDTLKTMEQHDRMIERAQKLLEKILEDFNRLEEIRYA